MILWARRWHVACLAGLLCVFGAEAHVYATKTLHHLVAEADLVLRARILQTDPGPRRSTESPGISRPAVEASVLELIKGKFEEPLVRFAQHGHGVARFEPGEETLLFLIRIERSRELAALGRTGAFTWVSLQEHRDEYPLVPATRGPLLAAVRDYVEAGAATSLKAQVAADLLKREDVEVIFLFISTYALSSTVLPVVQKAKVPVVILNIQPVAQLDYDKFNAMDDKGKMTGVWLEHCQSCSLPELACVFNRADIAYHVVSGYLQEDYVWQQINDWADAATVASAMRSKASLNGGNSDRPADVSSMVRLRRRNNAIPRCCSSPFMC